MTEQRATPSAPAEPASKNAARERKPFVKPAVKNLGSLTALTLIGGSGVGG